MNAAELERFSGLEAASRRAAGLTAEAARSAVTERGRFALALSGGSTPGRYFELLAQEDLPWGLVHVFWADERLVPPDSQDSNCRLARELLLSRVPIPEGNIHPMAAGLFAAPAEAGRPSRPMSARESSAGGTAGFASDGTIPAREVPRLETGLATPEEQAEAYESALRCFFGGDGPPAFDVIHLGLGGDGHTASLFPGQPALSERERWVVPVEYAKASPPVARLTLTLPVLNAARLAFFLVSGPDKARLAEEILAGRGEGYPAGLVRPGGRLVWLAGGG